MNYAGIPCPACGQTSSDVAETRPRSKGVIYRRRECLNCGNKFTTTETLASLGSVTPKLGGRTTATHLQRMAALVERVDRVQRSLDRLQAHVSDLSRHI